jgi:hypothetical protein
MELLIKKEGELAKMKGFIEIGVSNKQNAEFHDTSIQVSCIHAVIDDVNAKVTIILIGDDASFRVRESKAEVCAKIAEAIAD